MSKRRKAQRYRDLTCPRTRTSCLADGTRIVTVGSHVLVYPPPDGGGAAPPPPDAGSKAHPREKSAATGAVTTFEEHPLCGGFSDDSFKHYSLGVGLYFKGVRLLALVFALCALIQLPAVVLPLLVTWDSYSVTHSGMYFERTTVGNFGALLVTTTTGNASSTAASNLTSSLSSGDSQNWGNLIPSTLNRADMSLILSCLDTLSCLVLLVFCYWLRNRQQSEARAYSRREITVRKYTVEVSNLPPYFHDRHKLAQWFETRFGKVVDVCIAFDQHDLLDAYRTRGRIRKDIDMAVSHGEGARIDAMYDTLAKLDARIDVLQRDIPLRKTLCAFVSFEFQESRIACEKAFSHLWIRQLAGKLTNTTATTSATTAGAEKSQTKAKGLSAFTASFSVAASSGNGEDPNKSLLFGSARRVLYVSQAPEPSNIIFRNLRYSVGNKRMRKVVTLLATLLLLLVSVLAVYIAQRFQGEVDTTSVTCARDITAEDVRADSSLRDCFCYELGTTRALDALRSHGIDCGEWLRSYALAQGLSVLAVFVIVLINFILKAVIKALTLFEKHASLTRMQESVTNKLFVGLLLNTGVVLLVVNMQPARYAADLGFSLAFDGKYEDFVFEWFVHVGAPIILTMILNTINPHFLPLLKVPWRSWRRRWLCPPRRTDSQSVWNERYGGEPFELAERYAVLLNTMFVVLLYSGGMPLLLVIGAVTYALTYLFDRVSFLRLYRIPPRFDHSLAMYTTELLPYAIALHLCFTAWFLSAPPLVDTARDAAAENELLLENYKVNTIADRLGRWSIAPTLGLLAAVVAYLMLFRLGGGLVALVKWACSASSSSSSATEAKRDGMAADAQRFVPYSVARRTVTLETYHPHGSPFYHDAFLRTPSRKMLKIPAPLHVLAERAKKAAEKAQAEAELKALKKTQQEQVNAARAGADPQQIAQANASRSTVIAPPSVLHHLRGGSPSSPGSSGQGSPSAPVRARPPLPTGAAAAAAAAAAMKLEDVAEADVDTDADVEDDDDGEHAVVIKVVPTPRAGNARGTGAGGSGPGAASTVPNGLNAGDANALPLSPRRGPKQDRAASMGVDQRKSMVLSAAELSAIKESAKAAAKENGKRRLKGAVSNAGLVTDAQLSSPLVSEKKPKKKVLKPAQPKQGPSVIELPPLAPTASSASAGAAFAAPNMSPRAQQAAHLISGATVVLDIPSEEAEMLQANVEQSLRSPGEGMAAAGGQAQSLQAWQDTETPAAAQQDAALEHEESDEHEDEDSDDEEDDDFDGAAPSPHDEMEPRPFTAHLQHHAHLSLPTADPLLPLVTAEVHRLRSQLVEETARAQQARSRTPILEGGGCPRGGGGGSEAKPPSSRATGAGANGRRVADASSMAWGPTFASADGPSSPSHGTAHLPAGHPGFGASAAAAGHGDGGDAGDHGERDVLYSDEDGGDGASGDDGAVSDADLELSSIGGDLYEPQLVPTPCPNDACGRTLELVDTGAPQMYHCPFCATPFIM